jgi:hypothetical protein
MDSKKFFNSLAELGEFHCVRDKRRFSNRDRKTLTKSERHSMGASLGHFGHCLNGKYHHCEFELTRDIGRVVIYYWKTVQRNGEQVRIRGGKPLKTTGRGRPPVKNKKQ